MTRSRTDVDEHARTGERTRELDEKLASLDGDAPSSASAAIARTTNVPRGNVSIEQPSDVDDALASDLAQVFARWGRIQLVGVMAIFFGAGATTLLPMPATLIALVGVVPALVVGNVLVDRATVKEFVQLGLSPALARKLLRMTYWVPEAYSSLPAALSSSPAARQKIVDVIKKALAKC